MATNPIPQSKEIAADDAVDTEPGTPEGNKPTTVTVRKWVATEASRSKRLLRQLGDEALPADLAELAEQLRTEDTTLWPRWLVHGLGMRFFRQHLESFKASAEAATDDSDE